MSAQGAELVNQQYLRDHALTRGFMLGRPVSATVTPDGKKVIFLRAEPRAASLRLFEYDIDSKETQELVTPQQLLKGAEEQLSAEEKARRERMRVSVGGFTSYQLSKDGSKILLPLSGKLYLFDRATKEARPLNAPQGVIDPKFSPDGKSIAYVRDNDVYVLSLSSNKEHQVTKGGTPTKSNGLAEFVAQEEIGRFSGFWWSPDSRTIAYQETDTSEVEVWYVTDPAKPGQAPHAMAYPRPGRANAKVRLGLTGVNGGRTTWIEWDSAKYPYLATVTWPADTQGASLTICVQTRDQRELAVLAVDEKSGRTRPLHIEKDQAWINLDQQMPRWLKSGAGFLWTTERDGSLALELRSPTGAAVRTIVPPQMGYQKLVHVNEERGEIFFIGHPDPTEAHLHRIKTNGTDMVKLTQEKGSHNASFGRSDDYFVRTSLTADAMPAVSVHRATGEQVGGLPSVAEEPLFAPRNEVLKVGSNPELFAEIVRPRNFDDTKKYPVIVEVYGGPTANVVKGVRDPGILLRQWLADQGFIVVAIDNRGTPGRGRAWERAMLNSFATITLDDQVSGLRALAQKTPQMDLTRVGIRGWSFGGYMSALAALKRPDIYRAAVAGAPVVDWEDYDTHYTERYLGLPQQNAEVYKASSLLTYADKLQRPLLLVHGTSDDNVFFLHSLKLADALFKNRKHFEILPLSGLTHMVPDPVVMEALWTRTVQFFKTHLGDPE
ncbi:MAG TPA: DPP IV N-terminal domain-containing protein [Methylomirabilota bacterium]|nr:DPP IV N-terminal domain-containing protein [Methylomirabilota bacterium]